MKTQLSIGELAERAGVAPSALRFYEAQGLIQAGRSERGHRRFARDTLRRIAFIRVSQQMGIALDEIKGALASLPNERTPNERDWAQLSQAWRQRLNDQIGVLERLRDRLDGCIGCGCLSLKHCQILNPDDICARSGPGARHVLDPD